MGEGASTTQGATAHELQNLTEQDLKIVAQKLAATASKGDVFLLKGDLGAGKSTFARAFIRSLANDQTLEVPSPTFPLAIPYETARCSLTHFDLYRISDPYEIEELGLYEDLSTKITMIEWPENLGNHSLQDYIICHLKESDDGERRDLTIEAYGKQRKALTRWILINEFLDHTDWKAATWVFLQGDASTRSYIRMKTKTKNALLMNAPPQPDGPPIRDGKPYSQIAHLAENMAPFVAISQTLNSHGLKTPQIYHHDIKKGLLVIEDFGDQQYHKLITKEGHSINELYEPAIDLLVKLRGHKPETMNVDGITHTLPLFDETALGIETELVTDWYWPYVKKSPCTKDAKAEFIDVWSELFKKLEKNNQFWALRDFHSPNLIHLAGQSGLQSVGIIDFQDAVKAHAAYDLVSLCQDARLTIYEDLEKQLKERYITAVENNYPEFDKTDFQTAYAILGAQRATKLLGIFVRLSERDHKHHYLAHIPRIWDYLERNLVHPELAPLKNWYNTCFPDDLRTPFFKNLKVQATKTVDK